MPAESSAADIRARIGKHPLRFPLILDLHATLEEQVAASGFAPASSRFGPYCDNIMGMNWQLPAGRIVRIGERVVKSTTGYDWFRFLLPGDGRLWVHGIGNAFSRIAIQAASSLDGAGGGR